MNGEYKNRYSNLARKSKKYEDIKVNVEARNSQSKVINNDNLEYGKQKWIFFIAIEFWIKKRNKWKSE